jgi:hypothetical protein
MTEMRERAVDLARRGFRVFKLQVGGKLPVVERFYEIASDQPDAVRAMWTCPISGDSLDNNIGILTGGTLMVLDVDVKNGKQGAESLELLEDFGLPPDAPRARTPTGGLHIFLRTDSEVANSASAIAPGVDVRGRHGYVVGAGSVIGGAEYTWIQAPAQAMSEAVNG